MGSQRGIPKEWNAVKKSSSLSLPCHGRLEAAAAAPQMFFTKASKLKKKSMFICIIVIIEC